MKQYFEKKLSNGLKIITGEDLNSDTFTISVLARAGSRYETVGQRGYAHLMEHMLTKGTNSKPSAFAIGLITDRAGALYNASTNAERVQVYIQAARTTDEQMISLIADMVINPEFNPDTLENEKRVILQEIRESQDNESSRLYMETASRIFSGHPLERLPLGKIEDIQIATAEKLRAYHAKFFVANNMVVVINGGVSHERAFELCEKYFSGIPSGEFADNATPFSAMSGRADINFHGSKTSISISFATGKLNEKESQIVDIIGTFLGYRQTSLLNQELRQKRGLVYSISASTSEFSDSFMFSLKTATTEPGEVEKIIVDSVFHLEESFTRELFEEYKKQSINILLRSLGDEKQLNTILKYMWYVYGKLITPQEMVAMMEGATYEEMIHVKNKLFREDNMFVTRLLPSANVSE